MSRFLLILKSILLIGSFFSIRNVDAQIQVTGLQDFHLSFIGNSGNISASSNLCVYKSNKPSKYLVTASGPATVNGKNFLLFGPLNKKVKVKFYWNKIGGNRKRLHADASKQFSGAYVNNQSCVAASNAQFSIVIEENNLQSAFAGFYSSSFSITVEPV